MVRHATFPLFTFGPAAVVLASLGADASRAELPGWDTFALGGALIVGTYVALAVLERAFPHRPAWNQSQDDVRADVAYFVLVGPASAIAGGVLAALAGSALHATLPEAVQPTLWPRHWPAWTQVLLACGIAELGHYAAHRLGHEWPLLWRLHAIHHSAKRLYWLNATRFHPLDLAVLAFLQALPLEVLGIPPGIFVAYFVASSCYGQLQHCNIDLDARAYAWFFATPELHRWHHSTDPAEGDSNYGAILIGWDVLFRTRFWPGRPIDAPVGIGSLPRFPTGLLAQLRAPFRWRAVEREAGPDATP
ncbi:MAG: sterol desaturase family protein [Polyangiales bacterium]|nr:sterol desaturase family protein [Myxococcales bacterium]MCB9658081.1 sterol desaturase family protein [Sandaracinaceae bacterium]